MDDFELFYSDLKATEKGDALLTSQQQINRLLRPGSTYLNLNPFEVLQVRSIHLNKPGPINRFYT